MVIFLYKNNSLTHCKNQNSVVPYPQVFELPYARKKIVLIGYARVSKSDGSQTLDLQRDALLHAGVLPDKIYEDLASGRKDARPGLDACFPSAYNIRTPVSTGTIPFSTYLCWP